MNCIPFYLKPEAIVKKIMISVQKDAYKARTSAIYEIPREIITV